VREIDDVFIWSLKDDNSTLHLISGDEGMYLSHTWTDPEGVARGTHMYPTQKQLYQLAKYIIQYDY
jgi:hypothetical protein